MWGGRTAKPVTRTVTSSSLGGSEDKALMASSRPAVSASWGIWTIDAGGDVVLVHCWDSVLAWLSSLYPAESGYAIRVGAFYAWAGSLHN